MPNLFIVIATGQNVANLPPILEYGNEGDQVLWVESPEARKRGWSSGSRAVLARYGIATYGEVAVERINDPRKVYQGLYPKLQEIQATHPELTPVVVANGGQKLSPLGLYLSTNGIQPPAAWLYGENMPASYWCFGDGLNQHYEARPYTRHRLDLPDILEAADYQLCNMPNRFWPNESPPSNTPRGYGENPSRTADWHRVSYLRSRLRKHCDNQAPPQSHPPEIELTPKIRTKLVNGLHGFHCAIEKQRNRRCIDPGMFSGIAGGCDEQVLRAVLKVTYANYRAAIIACCKRQGPRLQSYGKLGDAFEQATARRTYHWLRETSGMSGIVQSAWHNVKVAHRSTPTKVAAEWDVLLVLKNGVLWSLECKAGTAEQKDLDARVYNLELAAGSHLARMAVVLPLYTQFNTEEWFEFIHDLRTRLKTDKPGLRLLFLGLSGQAEQYTLGKPPNQKIFNCPPFEKGLAELLRDYAP